MSRSSKPSSGASGLGGMFRSFTKTIKGGLSQTGPTQVQPTIVGGAPDLHVLLEQVSPSNSTRDRIIAAENIRTSIDVYSVSSIPEIWYSLEDMVSTIHLTECRRAGLQLMISCIQRGEDSYGSRMAYYHSIVNNFNMLDFDLQLKALKLLTNDGAKIGEFFVSDNRFPNTMTSWFQSLSFESQEISRGRKKDMTSTWGTSVEENFHNLLQFLINIFQNNASLFSSIDIEALVTEATLTCRKTPSESDVQYCLKFLDAVITCAFIPIRNLTSLLEILCGIVALPSQADLAWSLITNLSQSYISNNTFLYLCNILEISDRADTNFNAMRGAALYLQRLVNFFVEQKRDAEIPIIKVMHAYKSSLFVDSLWHKYEITSCVFNLLKDPITRDKFTYDIWESRDVSPLEILYQISCTSEIQKYARHPVSGGKTSSIISSFSFSSGGDNTQESVAKKIVDKFDETFTLVVDIYEQNNFLGPKQALIDFFVDMSPFIDEKSALIVIDHFKSSHYCNPLSRNWIANTDELLLRFFQDVSWESAVRQRVLLVMQDTFEIANEICEPQETLSLINKVFLNFESEPDNRVLDKMIDLFEVISKISTSEIMNHITNLVLQLFPKNSKTKNKRKSVNSPPAPNDFRQTNPPTEATNGNNNDTPPSTQNDVRPPQFSLESCRLKVVSAFCHIFIDTFKTSAATACIVYSSLLVICQRCAHDPLCYIEAARLLCRLRASADDYIYLSTPTNMDGLSASLGRNLTGLQDRSIYESTMIWWYPETISYLNEENLDVSSYVLKKYTDDSLVTPSTRNNEFQIDISLWFNEILGVIENGAHWEIYSFIWAHFGPQLSNIQLFRQPGCDIQKLRLIICDQITNKSKAPQVSFPKDVSHNDMKVTLIRTTSSLLSYHDIFSKRDEDYIVKAFVEGISTSEKAVVPCIHGLIVSCYELPLSIKKFLGQIFTKFQTKITNSSTSPHILEFLLSLSRLPSLTDNFTQDEYKRVFGMAIRYIQYAYDLARQEQAPESRVNTSGPNIGMIQNTIDSSNSKLLSQYLLVLAYNVIATWFLTIRLLDRKYMAKFIIRNLILAEGTPNSIDTQSMAYVDMITRFTYSNLDLTVQTTMPTATGKSQSNHVVKQWIYGSSIVSIDTDSQSGESQVMVRRPTGTSVFNLKPDEQMIPGWLEEFYLKLKRSGNSETTPQQLVPEVVEIFTPNHLLLQLMLPIDAQQSVKPLPISSDAATVRALGAFDRTPVVDFHKVGVMYIGPGQRDELEILGNSVGSTRYKRFLDGMGKLVRLKDNCKIYTGGLDILNDIDGEYAYVWNDKVSQLIFHTTTMMPPPANPHDTSFASKKRHIGNDFVNIFFDESEIPFEFGLVKSQFNFVNISITPISCTFFRSSPFIVPSSSVPSSPMPGTFGASQSNSISPLETKMFYKVRALCKPGVPAIFAACHLKIVSEDSLADFVRNLAIISSKFASVWNSQGGYISHWQYRLEQINTLREKAISESNKSAVEDSTKSQNPPQPQLTHQRSESIEKKEGDATITQSFLDQLSSPLETSESADKILNDSRGGGGPSGNPSFAMDEPDGQDEDLPLLKNLDFSYFT